MGSASLAIFILLLLGQDVRGAVDQLALSDASSTFSQRLYKEIAVSTPNIVFSPFSIHTALTMTSFGARGDTATEMSTALNLNTIPTIYDPHNIYRDLILNLNAVTDVELKTANGVFLNPSAVIKPAFIAYVVNHYFARVANFDPTAPGGPEKSINDWVANKTLGLIQDLLPAGSIDGSTALVLINTVSFNGTWETQFKLSKTRKQNFTRANGDKVEVDMMTDIRSVPIKRDNTNNVDVAELRYKGGRFVLNIALPRTPQGITALENLLLVPSERKKLFQDLVSTRVTLAVPRVKIETTLKLKGSLQNIGIAKAFSSSSANFSGISDYEQLFISDVYHQAKIEIQETGTVAAAATGVVIERLSAEVPPPESFIADRTFIYFLRDKETGTILFEGKFSG